MLEPTERAKLCLPASRLPQKEDFPSEHALEWVVDWEPTYDKDLGEVKWCEGWLLPGVQRMGAPGGVWEEEGDPVPMRGSWVSTSGPGRQQAWSPEPSRTPVLRSGQEGQVMFDSQQGRSLVLVTAWFAMYTSGSPAVNPRELLSGVAAVCVWSWWWWSCPSCFFLFFLLYIFFNFILFLNFT